jgi:predicted O-methyltransferase YrrM
MFEDCPVKIWQGVEEFEWLYKKVTDLKPKVILEIGTYSGGTLWYWHKLRPEKILAIDNRPPTVEIQGKWKKWFEGTGTTFYFYRAESQDRRTVEAVKERLNGEQVDFLFIDGDHHAHRCEHDWLAYWPLVRSGGFAAFHDIAHRTQDGDWYGVHRIWREIRESGLKTEEMIFCPDIMGTGIVWKP